MKIQNNKTKTATTIISALVIGLVLLSPTMVIPSVNAQPPTVAKTYSLPSPTMSTNEKNTLINEAMNLTGIKTWSNQWKYSTMNFAGEKTSSGTVNWKNAIVFLRLPSSSNAPVSCGHGWYAQVWIDLSTLKVVHAYYPTSQSHTCDSKNDLGPYSKNTLDSSTGSPMGYAIARQNDVAGSSYYYGNSATLTTPSYNNNIFTDQDELINGLLNAMWSTSACGSSTCFTQVGWEITDVAGSGSSGISADTADLVFVDQSTTGTYEGINTDISYSGGQSEEVSINCNYPSPTDVQINITYGSSTYQANTDVSCNDYQADDSFNNSVWFENKNTVSTSNWYSDVTGTYEATSAQEYDASDNAYNWSSSTNTDQWQSVVSNVCTTYTYASDVIESGTSLASGSTAEWTGLSGIEPQCT
ncbi:MAG: hypothetical protein KGI27_12475 [Thaumarchaeota archaeon]|nr:hypothetical protein [Nitrososphaerota archaeon]